MDHLTYPISPDYVKSWTTERAIAELIANALDEDPNATAVWADGRLVITDTGPGIPEEGLILGYSPKGDSSIGQFGEGAKIASLVLARATDVKTVTVSTVGYGFTPTVETRPILDGLAPRRHATPPQVLVYHFTASDRTRGTEIVIECPKKTAEAAIGRFRHLTEPGYTPPTETAQVLLDGPRGRLFIGGVLVSTNPRLHASYDFPLAAAKTAQNRDRTVIDAEVLTTLVSTALAGCADRAVVDRFVGLALDHKRLAEPERYFGKVSDPRVRAAFRTVARSRFAGKEVFYAHNGVDESALDLLDGDYELVTTNLDYGAHSALMGLLGVELARQVTQKLPDHRKRTTYVAWNKLTAAERRILDDAVVRTRTVFGAAAVAAVKVFSDTGDRYLACADGFYDPTSGAIAVRRDVLADSFRTLEVLLHEAGHRLAHRHGGEHADRTRGFENQLVLMLTGAVAALTDRTLGATPGTELAARAATDPDPAAVGQVAALVDATPQVPDTRALLADLLAAREEQTLKRYGVADWRKLADELGVHRNHLRLLREPRPAGWRTPKASMNPSTVSDYRMLEVVADAYGLRASVLWLGHLLCEGPRYGRPGAVPRPGPWSARIRASAELAAAELRGLGGVYAAAAERVEELVSAGVPEATDGGVGGQEWARFALDVLAAERARVTAEVPTAG